MPYLRPAQPGAADAWTQESAGRGAQRLIEVAATDSPKIRAALNLAAGEKAIVRRRLMLLDGEPVELTDSYYPEGIAAGTGLADTRKIKGGAPTLLDQLGHRVRRVIEEVTARGATPEEASRLYVAANSPVLELQRVSFDEADLPVEASIMVMKGPRTIRYETRVD